MSLLPKVVKHVFVLLFCISTFVFYPCFSFLSFSHYRYKEQSGRELITTYVVVRMTLMILFCITLGEDFLRPTYTLIRNHPVYVSACRNVHIVFCLCPSLCSFCLFLYVLYCVSEGASLTMTHPSVASGA